jgi:capsular exopolysaccharide synthesis family protein
MSNFFPLFRKTREIRKQQLPLSGQVTDHLLALQINTNGGRKVLQTPLDGVEESAARGSKDQDRQGQIDERLVAFHNVNTSAAEQYRRLYVEILRAGHIRELRTLLISSAMAGEGKTTVTLNLAITIASSIGEQSVLLVETDFRKPRVQRLLGTHPTCGLTDYLLGDVAYSEIFTTTAVPGLTVVHAGSRVKNPMALLSSESLEQFFKEVKSQEQYKYIIVDSSPILLASESGALIKHIDTAVLVVHARKTAKDTVSHAIEILGKDNILGCVFNALVSSDFYYYRQYYGSNYYGTEE